MTTKNNHYISKYLLRPWEFQKGKLRVFSFLTNEFSDEDNETLFSKTLIFSQEQEDFFSSNIEKVTSNELRTIADKDFKIKKWKSYRAMLLLLWDLVGRYAAAIDGDHAAVDFFTKMTKDNLDGLALAIDSKFKLVVVTSPHECRLFFPSNMLLSVFDPKTTECSFGIPFDGHNALFTIKREMDEDYLLQLSRGHFFCNISMGNHKTNLVVVHPDLRDQEDKIKPVLLKQRELNEILAKQIGSLRGLIKEVQSLVESVSNTSCR